MWKLPVLVVQVTVLGTTPEGNCGADPVLFKLSGVFGHVAGLVTTPGKSFSSD